MQVHQTWAGPRFAVRPFVPFVFCLLDVEGDGRGLLQGSAGCGNAQGIALRGGYYCHHIRSALPWSPGHLAIGGKRDGACSVRSDAFCLLRTRAGTRTPKPPAGSCVWSMGPSSRLCQRRSGRSWSPFVHRHLHVRVPLVINCA